MSIELISAVERALSTLAQEVHHDASVVVQFAAGEWHALKEALAKAKADVAPGSSVPPPSEQPASAQEPGASSTETPAEPDQGDA